MAGATGGPVVDERALFSQLRRGDLVGVLAAVQSVDVAHRSVSLAVLGAEAAVCLGRGDLDELERLRDVVHAAGDTTLALRMEATLADHHATLGHPLSGIVAAQALAAVGEETLRDADALWARGRLWRTLALATLFIPDDRPGRSLALVERAKADFVQAGFDVEWCRCAADLHFIWTLVSADDVDRTSDTVDECIARLRQRDAPYLDLVLGYRAYLDLAQGDMAAADARVREVENIAAERPAHRFALVTVGFVRSASALVTHGPTTAVRQAIDAHLGWVRATTPYLLSGQMVGLAAILVDLGYLAPEEVAVARRWAAQAGAGEASFPSTSQDLEALNAQLALLERPDPEVHVAAVDAVLERGRERGLRRDTARQALRSANVARWVGLDDVADRWFVEGVSDLPPPGRRTFWERTAVSAAAQRVQSSPGIALHLLGPEVELEAGDTRRPLSLASARLVVALVAEGGAAPTDRLVEVLWPGIDAEVGRARLRVALHRLRRLLRRAGGDDADPLPRRGDLVVLSPTVEVDAMRFEKLASGSPADRVAALDLYRGAVAEAQLAYDDTAAPLRRRLAATWRDLADEALGRTDLARTVAVRIATVAARSATTDPDVADILRRAEDRLAGR